MITAKNKNIVYQFLFGLIIFLIPSNLFFKFIESSAYVNGLLIDYLIPKLYLSDLVIFTLFGWWLFDNKKIVFKNLKKVLKKITLWINKNKIISFLLLALILRQFNTHSPIAAYWYLLKIIEFGFLTFILMNKKKLISSTLIISSTIFTLFFQSILTILQFINQSSIFGYMFLGESDLNRQIGLAKQTINGIEKILPYGTTAHPNILGGIISLYLILLIGTLINPQLKKKKYHLQPFIVGPIIISLIALGLTFSLSAWTTFIIGIVLIFKKINTKKLLLLSLSLIILTPILLQLGSLSSDKPSIKRRAYLNHAGINMLKSNPIWGVGLNNFTTQVEKYSPAREVVRFTQPSHHSLILILSEIGLLGLATTILLVQKNKKLIKKNIKWGSILLLIITPIIVLDHYFFTNQSGLLLIITTGVITRNFLFPLRK
jgi:O-antigen ligase